MRKITLDDNSRSRLLFGEKNINLKLLARATGVKVAARGNQVTLRGTAPDMELAEKVILQLYDMVDGNGGVSSSDVEQAVRLLSHDRRRNLRELFLESVLVAPGGRRIAPKSEAQQNYVDAMKKYDIVFSIGPAGTGKTYLAMAMAVASLQRKQFRRIVLTRPAVEAGERLGFLPGDLVEKVNPYLRPLYDALHDMMDLDRARGLLERDIVEVAPLAFMRGRTLNESFVILDEAQNSTAEQMKMFLTRLGMTSKAVITGDVTQVDLPHGRESGLIQASRILRGIKGIAFCSFSDKDVVRHHLVQEIVRAYEHEEMSLTAGQPKDKDIQGE
ncbi:MAG: PhoH family protein [Deltaproteobacteria bacterium]|nr:PhoH family protein [Deltaproteobacteria bacterium]